MTNALAVYGTLAPGEENHWVVRGLAGEWRPGVIRGWVFELTWGPADGYPGLVLDPDGSAVPVHVIESDQLTSKWREIDEFEGEGYQRVFVDVEMHDGTIVTAQVYEAITEGPD